MGLFDNPVIKHKQDWVPEVFPAGLPAVMLRAAGIPAPGQVVTGLTTAGTPEAPGALAPLDVLELRSDSSKEA